MKQHEPAIQRVMKRITVTEAGCWMYPTLNENGYGVVSVGYRGGRLLRTHRLTYTEFVGPIPDGLDVDHLCRVRACCNPEHLEPVTRAVNAQRGLRKTMQTHCKQGHPLSGDNLKVTEKQRMCLTCARRNSRESQRRRRAKMKESN